MINTDKVYIELTKINDKSPSAIINDSIWIPSLGHPKNKSIINRWLNKRVGYLNDALSSSQEELDNINNIMISELDTSLQVHAQDVLNGIDIFDRGLTENQMEELFFVFIYNIIVE